MSYHPSHRCSVTKAGLAELFSPGPPENVCQEVCLAVSWKCCEDPRHVQASVGSLSKARGPPSAGRRSAPQGMQSCCPAAPLVSPTTGGRGAPPLPPRPRLIRAFATKPPEGLITGPACPANATLHRLCARVSRAVPILPGEWGLGGKGPGTLTKPSRPFHISMWAEFSVSGWDHWRKGG